MMWSKQKSPRFEKEKPTNPIGPGYYDLPSVLHEQSVTIPGSDRFQEQPMPETPGPGSYAQGTKASKAKQCKENRPPSRDRNSKQIQSPKQVKGDFLQTKLEEEEHLRREAEGRLLQLTESARQTAAEYAQLRGEHFTLAQTQEKSKIVIADLQAALTAIEEKVPQLESQLVDAEAARAAAAQHKQEAESLRAEVPALRKQLEDSEAAHAAAAKQHAEEVQRLQGEVSQVPELKKQLAEMEAMRRAAAVQHECAEERLQTEVAQVSELQKQLQEAKASTDAIMAEQAEEISTLQATASKVPGLEKNLFDIEAALAAAREESSQVESLQAEVPGLRKQLEDSEAAHAAAAKQHAEEVQRLQGEVSQVSELQQQVKDMEAALEAAAKEQEQESCKSRAEASQVHELTKRLADLEAAGQKAAERHEQDLQKLREEASSSAIEHEGALASLQAEVSQVPLLKERLAEAEATITVQRQAELQAQAAEAELHKKLADAEAKCQSVELEANETEVTQLQEQLAAARAENSALMSDKDQLKKDLEKLKFAEINANMTKNAKERAEAQVRDLKMDLEQWRSKAQSFVRDEDKMKRQEEDVGRLEQEAKDLHQQNAQLLVTFQQFKTEWDLMRAENQSLQETLATYEMNLDRATDHNAQMMGHVNPKQKIRHMVNLKEENKELREQLKKAKQRITQLGGEGLLEALASFSHRGLGADQLSIPASACPDTPCQSVQGESRTPKRPSTPSRKMSPRRGSPEEEYQVWLADEDRRRQLQDRAVERVQTDFQHFIALIERAVLSGEMSGDSPNPAALLERLRSVVHPAMQGGRVASGTP
ncbi:unnamed protein product [Effrenium voratum]|uniref:Hyaluronan-mediated motility receptor C-terminal domain-containing protein n=1 Tax=Effrenium voratum TaxID=2562239 RepID=A0AA36JK49_9DINO|nr:unnamed protein product [Effrenium voratum]